MLNTININLKTDIKTDRPTTLPIKLMSQDKNNNQFILRFTNGGESVTLDDSYTVEVLTKFTKSGTSRLTTAKVRQDYATWEFDTAYITQDETVYNYVYVRKSGNLVVSADANCFVFSVDLSEIDKGAGKVAETYDENYEKVLLDYSSALDERTTERLDEAVGDFNQRGDAEIADWREGADVELEDYLADRVVIKNLIENGDFSDGWTGWSRRDVLANSSGITEDLDINDYVTTPNSVKWTLDNSNLRYRWDINIGSTGDIFYARVSTKKDVSLYTIFYDFETNNSISSALYIPHSNQWITSSIVGESTSNGISFGILNGTAVKGTVNFDDLMVINLTETFGAGNEPTKEEMDELIKITGYFDEIALTNKQLLNWQLNLIRQNRNALIALGGTII